LVNSGKEGICAIHVATRSAILADTARDEWMESDCISNLDGGNTSADFYYCANSLVSKNIGKIGSAEYVLQRTRADVQVRSTNTSGLDSDDDVFRALKTGIFDRGVRQLLSKSSHHSGKHREFLSSAASRFSSSVRIGASTRVRKVALANMNTLDRAICDPEAKTTITRASRLSTQT